MTPETRLKLLNFGFNERNKEDGEALLAISSARASPNAELTDTYNILLANDNGKVTGCKINNIHVCKGQ